MCRIWHVKSLTALCVASALLSACTSVPVAVCPAVVAYTPGQQDEAAGELLALPPGSILTQMLLDYHSLREKLKVCQ